MDNNFYQPNISLDAIEEESRFDGEPKQTKTTYDVKNYLNTRLATGETSKTITIRILPSSPENSNPFTHVHFHSFTLNAEQMKGMKSTTKNKSFVCLNKKYNPTIDITLGERCPFCEKAHELYEKANDESLRMEEREMYRKEANKYLHGDNVIIRCIERGKESEGVKFWKIHSRRDGSDPYHKILNIVKKRNEESLAATGQKKNILDLYNGRDFTLTITPGNNNKGVAIDVIDAGIETPLSRDNNEIMTWVNDPKRWDNVYGCKPTDYLELVVNGKVPWYDKNNRCWVDGAQMMNKMDEQRASADAAIVEAEAALVGTTYSMPVPPPSMSSAPVQQPTYSQPAVPQQPVYTTPVQPQAPAYNTTADDDDLPF